MALAESPALVWTAALVLAGIFLPSAWSKLRALDEFEGIVADYRILPGWLVRPAARALPLAELLAGALVLLPAGRAAGAALAVALLLLFALAMAVNLARGRREIDCGCFLGRQKERIGWLLVARNLALAALAMLLLGAEGEAAPALFDLVTIAFASLSLLALYAAFSRLAGLPHPQRPRRA